MEKATAAHRPLGMETASRRQSATTEVRGSIGSAEIFDTTAKRGVHRDVLLGAGRLVGLGLHAGKGEGLRKLFRRMVHGCHTFWSTAFRAIAIHISLVCDDLLLR
jgi:hypothetical protein